MSSIAQIILYIFISLKIVHSQNCHETLTGQSGTVRFPHKGSFTPVPQFALKGDDSSESCVYYRNAGMKPLILNFRNVSLKENSLQVKTIKLSPKAKWKTFEEFSGNRKAITISSVRYVKIVVKRDAGSFALDYKVQTPTVIKCPSLSESVKIIRCTKGKMAGSKCTLTCLIGFTVNQFLDATELPRFTATCRKVTQKSATWKPVLDKKRCGKGRKIKNECRKRLEFCVPLEDAPASDLPISPPDAYTEVSSIPTTPSLPTTPPKGKRRRYFRRRQKAKLSKLTTSTTTTTSTTIPSTSNPAVTPSVRPKRRRMQRRRKLRLSATKSTTTLGTTKLTTTTLKTPLATTSKPLRKPRKFRRRKKQKLFRSTTQKPLPTTEQNKESSDFHIPLPTATSSIPADLTTSIMAIEPTSTIFQNTPTKVLDANQPSSESMLSRFVARKPVVDGVDMVIQESLEERKPSGNADENELTTLFSHVETLSNTSEISHATLFPGPTLSHILTSEELIPTPRPEQSLDTASHPDVTSEIFLISSSTKPTLSNLPDFHPKEDNDTASHPSTTFPKSSLDAYASNSAMPAIIQKSITTSSKPAVHTQEEVTSYKVLHKTMDEMTGSLPTSTASTTAATEATNTTKSVLESKLYQDENAEIAPYFNDTEAIDTHSFDLTAIPSSDELSSANVTGPPAEATDEPSFLGVISKTELPTEETPSSSNILEVKDLYPGPKPEEYKNTAAYILIREPTPSLNKVSTTTLAHEQASQYSTRSIADLSVTKTPPLTISIESSPKPNILPLNVTSSTTLKPEPVPAWSKAATTSTSKLIAEHGAAGPTTNIPPATIKTNVVSASTKTTASTSRKTTTSLTTTTMPATITSTSTTKTTTTSATTATKMTTSVTKDSMVSSTTTTIQHPIVIRRPIFVLVRPRFPTSTRSTKSTTTQPKVKPDKVRISTPLNLKICKKFCKMQAATMRYTRPCGGFHVPIMKEFCMKCRYSPTKPCKKYVQLV